MHPTHQIDDAQQPLLSSPPSDDIDDNIKPTRDIEDTVLPETASLGRNLSWTSAYILVISRIMGRGIFATPGSIVKATGSVRQALLLRVGGALISG